ncbi:hypothetical protein BH11PSE13_BH11PSE13_12100 [soil metagenome]
MSAHRYWRLSSLTTLAGAGELELTEVQLLNDTTRVDAAITLTASIAPASGSLSTLQDNSAAGTSCKWPTAKGLAFYWDMGSAVNACNFLLGSGDSAVKFVMQAALFWSDDNINWTQYVALSCVLWPGPRSLTGSESRFRWGRGDDWNRRVGGQINTHNDPSVGSTGVMTDDIVSTRGYHRCRVADSWRSSGVLQAEFLATAYKLATSNFTSIYGVQSLDSVTINVSTPNLDQQAAGSGLWMYATGNVYNNNSTPVAAGTAWALNDVIGIVVDFGAGTLQRYKNGTAVGALVTGLTGKTLCLISGSFSSDLTTDCIRQGATFAYPIAGATPWFEGQLIKQNWIVGVPMEPEAKIATAITKVEPGKAGPLLLKTYLSQRDWLLSGIGEGIGRINGVIEEDGTPDFPVWRRTRLMRDRDGLLVRETWSDPLTGVYDFTYIDETEKYTVLSYDHNHNFRAVVADNLTPDLMRPSSGTVPAVSLRAAGADARANVSAFAPLAPASAVPGDLLVHVFTHRAAVTAVPAGWVFVGTSGPASAGAVTQQTSIYMKPSIAGDAGVAIGTFTLATAALVSAQVLALKTNNSSGAVPESNTGQVVNNTVTTTAPLPDVTTGAKERIAIAVASSINANTTPTVSAIAMVGGAGWTQVSSASVDQNRMGVFVKALSNTGVTTAGTPTFAGASGSNGTTAQVAVFATP